MVTAISCRFSRTAVAIGIQWKTMALCFALSLSLSLSLSFLFLFFCECGIVPGRTAVFEGSLGTVALLG